jgi:alanyl-tRNA synthetase
MGTRRRYYDDAFEREFDAHVVSCCEPAVHGGVTAWEIVLDSTAFYPTSGGQPHDLGKLNDANILDVRDEGDEIIHLVDRNVPAGPVHCCLDWGRRFDHMQQHTGQHLLSAVFQERFGRPTVSFHLGADACTIDLRGPEPSEEILEGAERAANQIIFEDRPITVRYGTPEQLATLGVRKEVDRDGILRAIEIEGVDLQPCGGTHVKRTAQIGMVLVRDCSKVRQDWRVEFLCGRRAERAARQDFLRLRDVAQSLKCAAEDVVASAGRAVEERDSHFKNARALAQRLAQLDAGAAIQSTPPAANGARLIARVFQEDTQAEYLNHFATELAKTERTTALLGRFPCGHLIFAQHPSCAADLNALLKQVLKEFGGKGGGTPHFARGRLDNAANVDKAIGRATALLSETA